MKRFLTLMSTGALLWALAYLLELVSRLTLLKSFGPPEVVMCYGFIDLILVPLIIYLLPGILLTVASFVFKRYSDYNRSFTRVLALNCALIFLFYAGLWIHVSVLGGIELLAAVSICASIALFCAAYLIYYIIRKSRPGRVTPGRLLAACLGVMLLLTLLSAVIPIRLRDARLAGPGEEGRDILLVTLDTVRRDALGCYGNTQFTTPTLDSLSRSGLLYKQVVSQSPYTAPSHASLLTSLYPAAHGVRTNGLLLEDGVMTLPALLAKNGYRSVAILSGSSLSHDLCGLNSGFQIYDEVFTPFEGFMRTSMGECIWKFFRKALPGSFASLYRELQERKASETVDTALSWMNRMHGKVFMWVHFFDSHFTYIPPPPYETMYDPEFTGEFRPYEHLSNPGSVFHNEIGITEREKQHGWALYGGEISYIDRELGRFLAKLDAMNRLENTLVIVVADHGEYFGEHGYYFTHEDLYEEVLNVPLIIVDPALGTDSGRTDTIAEIVDIMPTILQIVMSPIPENLQGESLIEDADGDINAFSDCGPCGKISVRNTRSMMVFDLQSEKSEFMRLDGRDGSIPAEDERNLGVALENWSAKLGLTGGNLIESSENERLRSLGYIH